MFQTLLDRRAHRLRHVVGNVGLSLQFIGHGPIVGLGPDNIPVAGTNELRGPQGCL